ncbi:LamD-like [Mycobacterium phage DyoEdafos]|uniref:LamD-like protein n=1 Tax=Mycobacterium phage DyoEdafos TaxID=2599860 RepID=A0A5J6THD5_9CAUD|nr:LamD-like [Mycobacterium phage DyoEdafos]QFG10331.1 LamD-like protein [Mycobacterium phage DyoEdafos]
MMSGPKFGVLAGTRERAKAIFRQLGWEQGHDRTFALSKWGEDARGVQLDVLLVDETALPIDRTTWESYKPCLATRNGVAYALQSLGPEHIRPSW